MYVRVRCAADLRRAARLIFIILVLVVVAAAARWDPAAALPLIAGAGLGSGLAASTRASARPGLTALR